MTLKNIRPVWLGAFLVALVCVGVAPATSAPRGSDPATTAGSLCPRLTTVPPDDDCYSIPLPGEAWGVAAILTPPTPEALALYESLIPEPYGMPETPQVGVFISRLNVGGANSGFDADPGPGYQEGSVALRATLPKGHNTPWDEGWFVISQPINDTGQYGSGRDVGIPKYMADMSITHGGDRIVQDARGWTFGDPGRPGLTIDALAGNTLVIDWTDSAFTGGDAEAVAGLVSLDAPLLGHDRPYDELAAAEHVAELTKFTPAAYVPAGEAGAVTPLTAGPDVRLGATTVTLSGTIPVANVPFSALVGSGPQTVLGAAAYVSGFVHMTFDGLDY